MINFFVIWLILIGICILPAIILGSIFHYYIRICQLDYLIVIFITIAAIGLASLLTCTFLLYVIGYFEIELFFSGMIAGGACGFFASLIRVFWLKMRRIDLNKGNEVVKTILFFNFSAATLIVTILVIVISIF